MTHRDHTIVSGPSSLRLRPEDLDQAAGTGGVRLLVAGQATVSLTLARKQAFEVWFSDPDAWGTPTVRWVVDRNDVTLYLLDAGEWMQVERFTRVTRGFAGQDYRPASGGGMAGAPSGEVELPDAEIGVDSDPTCVYWFSFDCHNRRLLYGKGEMRRNAALACHTLPAPTTTGSDPAAWMRSVRVASITPAPAVKLAEVWRDPVCIDPPLRVLATDAITMEQIARYTHTVPTNLSPECKLLYDNVAGANFRLDDDSFTDFSRAIEESITHADGWCHEKLQKKAYLRITLGVNQGESPGIPFVMEIWPPGSRSSIHNHGGAHAVIKVLHGQISVDLYRMLSDQYTESFMSATFSAGEVTWLTPRLNQNHVVYNQSADTTGITIQCYLYTHGSDQHYPYFDYIQKGGQPLGHFDPNSDMDFLEFKKLMREEWERRHPDGA